MHTTSKAPICNCSSEESYHGGQIFREFSVMSKKLSQETLDGNSYIYYFKEIIYTF